MDFKSVLQVYNRMGTDAVLQDDHNISRAVRQPYPILQIILSSFSLRRGADGHRFPMQDSRLLQA
jgi:hypothetical protein